LPQDVSSQRSSCGLLVRTAPSYNDLRTQANVTTTLFMGNSRR